MLLELNYRMELVIKLIALVANHKSICILSQTFEDLHEFFRTADVKRRVEDFIHDEKVGRSPC